MTDINVAIVNAVNNAVAIAVNKVIAVKWNHKIKYVANNVHAVILEVDVLVQEILNASNAV